MYRKSEIIMTRSFSERLEKIASNQDIEERNREILIEYYEYVTQQLLGSSFIVSLTSYPRMPGTLRC